MAPHGPLGIGIIESKGDWTLSKASAQNGGCYLILGMEGPIESILNEFLAHVGANLILCHPSTCFSA